LQHNIWLVKKEFLVTSGSSTKAVEVLNPVTVSTLHKTILQRFSMSADSSIQNVQYLDKEWGAYVNLEDCTILPDRSQLKCDIVTRPCTPLGDSSPIVYCTYSSVSNSL
jgi:hypothetical protein